MSSTQTMGILIFLFTLCFSLAQLKPIRVIESTNENRKVNSTTTIPILKTCRPGQFIKRDCKFYIECYDGHWRRNFCPQDKYWNDVAKKCDHLHNVPECNAIFEAIVENHRKASQSTSPPSTQTKQDDVNRDEYDDSEDDREEYKESEFDEEDKSDGNDEMPIMSPSKGESFKRHISTDQTYRNILKYGPVDRYEVNLTDTDDDYDNDFDDKMHDTDYGKDKQKLNDNEIIKKGKDIMSVESGKDELTKGKRNKKEEIVFERIMTDDSHLTNNKMPRQEIVRSSDMMVTSTTPRAITTPPNTKGKVCVVKGKMLVCHDIPETTTLANDIVKEEKINTIDKGKEKINSKTISASNANWSLQIEVKVDQSVERFVRLMAHYINLTIMVIKA